jgi:hypothetical protein
VAPEQLSVGRRRPGLLSRLARVVTTSRTEESRSQGKALVGLVPGQATSALTW